MPPRGVLSAPPCASNAWAASAPGGPLHLDRVVPEELLEQTADGTRSPDRAGENVDDQMVVVLLVVEFPHAVFRSRSRCVFRCDSGIGMLLRGVRRPAAAGSCRTRREDRRSAPGSLRAPRNERANPCGQRPRGRRACGPLAAGRTRPMPGRDGPPASGSGRPSWAAGPGPPGPRARGFRQREARPAPPASTAGRPVPHADRRRQSLRRSTTARPDPRSLRRPLVPRWRWPAIRTGRGPRMFLGGASIRQRRTAAPRNTVSRARACAARAPADAHGRARAPDRFQYASGADVGGAAVELDLAGPRAGREEFFDVAELRGVGHAEDRARSGCSAVTAASRPA